MLVLKYKALSIPIELCISVMPPHMYVDGVMLAGEEHEYETV